MHESSPNVFCTCSLGWQFVFCLLLYMQPVLIKLPNVQAHRLLEGKWHSSRSATVQIKGSPWTFLIWRRFIEIKFSQRTHCYLTSTSYSSHSSQEYLSLKLVWSVTILYVYLMYHMVIVGNICSSRLLPFNSTTCVLKDGVCITKNKVTNSLEMALPINFHAAWNTRLLFLVSRETCYRWGQQNQRKRHQPELLCICSTTIVFVVWNWPIEFQERQLRVSHTCVMLVLSLQNSWILLYHVFRHWL